MTVSVVVPCFNSSAFVRETVESVLAQTVGGVEIVLVDDGSTDRTSALLTELAFEHPAITTCSQANAGVAAARNRAIELARGEHILPLDADDLLEPDAIERSLRAAEDPSVALVFFDRRDFGELSGVYPSGPFELSRLKYFNQLPYCALYRRSLWESVGGYRTNVTGFDDWDFWIAAAALGVRAHHIAAPLIRHRRHSRSQLGSIVHDYERLFATIVTNNAHVYSEAEVDAARRYLSERVSATFLAASRRIFIEHYGLP